MKLLRWIKVKLQETIKPNISNKSKNILGVDRVEQFMQRRNVEVSLSYDITVGTFNDGNVRTNTTPYVRTPCATMTAVTTRAKNAAPKVVYTDMVRDMEVDDPPRNSRVISNKQYRDRSSKFRRNKGAGHHANFADEMQSLCSMIASDSLFSLRL